MANDSVYNLVDRAAINATDRLGVWHTSGATRAQYLEVGFLGLAVSDLAAANANQTGVVGTLQHWDLSSLSQNRDWTLPATAAVGERCGLYIDTGDATDEILIKNPSGDTIDGTDHSSTPKTRLFQTGELMVFRCIVASTAWITEYDGRIATACRMYPSVAVTTNAAATWLDVALNTENHDRGDLGDAGNGYIKVRRAGRYVVSGATRPDGFVSDANYYSGGIEINDDGTNHVESTLVMGTTGTAIYCQVADVVSLNADDYLKLRYRSQEANKGYTNLPRIVFLGVSEVL